MNNTTHIVVYSPLENFFYNTDGGATVIAYFFLFIVSALVGATLSAMLGASNRIANNDTAKTIAGLVIGIATFFALRQFIFA